MKQFLTKLFFIAFLTISISSFVLISADKPKSEVKDEINNVRFDTEMDNGFTDRESRN